MNEIALPGSEDESVSTLAPPSGEDVEAAGACNHGDRRLGGSLAIDCRPGDATPADCVGYVRGRDHALLFASSVDLHGPHMCVGCLALLCTPDIQPDSVWDLLEKPR